MADQGRWFKLWCSALDDDALDGLTIQDFGRWAKMGAHVKEQGTTGTLTITAPARALCAKMQVENFTELLSTLARFPHIKTDVTGVTVATVTFNNWAKYQGDNSAERVRKFRESVTVQKIERVTSRATRARAGEKRREEKRREENKDKIKDVGAIVRAQHLEDWLTTLKSNPAYEGLDLDREFGKMRAWCEANRKVPSYRRLVNWLNHAERPLGAAAEKRTARTADDVRREQVEIDRAGAARHGVML